jgi:uncharacterized protein
MPVRSLRTSVLRWPDHGAVHSAVTEWSRRVIAADSRVTRVGYAGSYARSDWGVGSDVDVVVLLRDTREHFMERGRAFDATELPVPADVLVYTEAEWDRVEHHGGLDPVVWIDGSGAQ